MYDIIGEIYTPGTYDENGEELTSPTLNQGWHVNSPHPVEGWESYLVTPSTPRRVFAGHATFCYAFPSKEHFEELISPPEPAEVVDETN